MKATTLKRAIEVRGGNAEIVTKQIKKYDGSLRDYTELLGTLNEYDVAMIVNDNGSSGFYTVREVKNRGEYDAGSDYNPGGYTYCHTQNDLDWATS